ncbi:MAG TPA: MFS transporter [Candidatus Latescibacteria bacterium]|nr:MFS transporter [Candidatus Latescibacterota bacterium]
MTDNASVPPTSKGAPTRHYGMVALIMLTFFVISLLTNIIGPLVPDIIKSFELSLTLVALLPFAFFIAYGFMSIPAGMLLERCREKTVMICAFALAFAGALLFSAFPRYPTAIVSLFLIGAGMAALQVAINPLLRVAGGEEHYAFNSVLAQLFFGGASFLSPFIYTYFVRNLGHPGGESKPLIGMMSRLVPPNLPWVAVYWVFAVLVVVMIVVLAAVRFPVVVRKEEERAGAWATHKVLFKNKTVILYFFGIFAYVGTEQGVANWISQFLLAYHRYDPQTVGAGKVSLFWGLMTVGGMLGLVLLKFLDSRKVLLGFSAAALVFLSLALFGPGPLALVMFPLMGFAAAVMWPIIFSLALNSVSSHHGSFSGILCTGIIGGALVPLAIGRLGDLFGLRHGMLILYLTLGYILSIGLWARPLIANETIAMKKKKEAA